MQKPAPKQAIVVVEEISPYSITILHASWGLNCDYGYMDFNTQKDHVFANSSDKSKLKEDNVFSKVFELCNGKKQCEIQVNTEILGSDPAPGCGDKKLKVEYRCFSFDRPWIVYSSDRKLQINCNKPKNK